MTTTITDPKLDKIHNLYAAYGRGDVAGALADLADDVDWAAEASGDAVPWFGTYRGKDRVPEFFAAIASNVDVTQFEVVGRERTRRNAGLTAQQACAPPRSGRRRRAASAPSPARR